MFDPREVGSPAYTNPVYKTSFPDPFVLKFCGEYFAYCTGFAQDGNVFTVLRSTDLVNWAECGGAMKPLTNSPPLYWAPETTYDNGKFYLYYSVGNETLMEIRVAVSERPDGGYVDCGRQLTSEDFAIDPHVFIDDDGAKYLFYARDFLEHTHIGTGTVVDRMIDWFTLAGDPHPVTRAKYDWQVYDPQRKEKGGVRWHTVEGPAVLKRKGLYFEMFSGGNWQNATYGVSYAVSDKILREDEWPQFSDGERVLPILRTIPDVALGPGHNCVVRGPNNREIYCIYHRWDGEQRLMAIDRLDHAGERLFVCGPTHTPQLVPFAPAISEKFRSSISPAGRLDMTGSWEFQETGAVSGPRGRASIRPQMLPKSFLCEISWECLDPINQSGELGLLFRNGDSETRLSFSPEWSTATLMRSDDSQNAFVTSLPGDFVWSAIHLFRVEGDRRRVKVRLDSLPVNLDLTLDGAVSDFELFANNQSVAVRSFELTNSFEELFEDAENLANDWTIEPADVGHIRSGELVVERQQTFSLVREEVSLLDLEFAVNIRLLEQTGQAGLILSDGNGDIFQMMIGAENRRIRVSGGLIHDLAEAVDLTQYHQLKVIKKGGHVVYFFDGAILGSTRVENVEVTPRFSAVEAAFAIEMIRLTAI